MGKYSQAGAPPSATPRQAPQALEALALSTLRGLCAPFFMKGCLTFFCSLARASTARVKVISQGEELCVYGASTRVVYFYRYMYRTHEKVVRYMVIRVHFTSITYIVHLFVVYTVAVQCLRYT